MSKVVIVVPNVKQFRRRFYELLNQSLGKRGVELCVIYSDPEPSEALKKDSIDLTAVPALKVMRHYLLRGRILVQLVPFAEIRSADLIVVIQASGYLLNYPLLVLSLLGLKRVAFWGHGLNRQGTSENLSEKVKRLTLSWVNWWFAYTKGTAEYLCGAGYPRSRITVVANAIDTKSLAADLDAISDGEVAVFRRSLGLGGSSRVAVYCGSLYAHKRIHFLLDAAEVIRRAIPEFRLVVVGGGEDRRIVDAHARLSDTVRYLGPAFDRTKLLALRASEVFLCPGLVGLAVLDSFAAGLPLLTTTDALHSPEIEYLEDGMDGAILEAATPNQYADAVVRVLEDRDLLLKMQRAARQKCAMYSIEQMAQNFSEGILGAMSR